MYLPDHFKPKQQILDDGTVIQLASEAEQEQQEEEKEKKIALIEVKPSSPEEEESRRERLAAVPSEKVAMVEQLKAQMEQKTWAVEHPDPLVKSKVPISRAERRRLIKEEIQRLSQSEEKIYYQRRLW
jgi:hypothetical protein